MADQQSKRKFIVDCDTGVDDAQAIMMLLAQSDVDVLAITVVNGNCDVDQACKNTLKVLHVCDRLEIPVYKGARKPMVDTEPELKAPKIHGGDGLGDADLDFPDLELRTNEHAVHALTRLVNEHRGDVTLVTLGPLTNLALALNLDEHLGDSLKEVVTMGGNIEAHGSSALCAEFNFAVDPYAAHVVLQELGPLNKLTLVPYETCCIHNSIPWEWYDRWSLSSSNKGKFNAEIMKKKAALSRQSFPHYVSCDPVAMAVAIDNEVVMESIRKYCVIELHGRYTKSQMIVDWQGRLDEKPNVTLVKKYHVDTLLEMLEKATI